MSETLTYENQAPEPQDKAPTLAHPIRRGVRVVYQHGRGLSTGKVVKIEDGVATIKTRNGFFTTRAVAGLERA